MLTFDPSTHEYRDDGAIVPHVTQVIDGLVDFSGIPESVMAATRDRGQAVHLLTEYHDRGELDEESLPEELRGFHAAYVRFLHESGFSPTAIEQIVYSEKYRYAGKLDRIGTMKSRGREVVALVDIKAVSSVAAAVGPQTAAYQQAAAETGIRNISARYALQLRGDGTYKLHECADRSDLSVFLAALTVANWRSKHVRD